MDQTKTKRREPLLAASANQRWYLNNKERAAAKRDAWRAANPERYAAHVAKEASRLRNKRLNDTEYKEQANKKLREKYHATKDTKREWLLLQNARRRAAVKKLPIDITVEDIHIPKTCPVFGFSLEHASGAGGSRYNSPTLDRIIPSLGYVKGNIRVISKKANVMKHDATPEELLTFARWALATMDSKEA